MRVLILNQYFPPDNAATARLLGELAMDLSSAHQVHVIAGRPSYDPDVGAPPPSEVVVTRARSATFGRTSMLGRAMNYLTFLGGALVATLRAPRPDVVLAFTDPPVIGAVAAVSARLRQVPFVQIYWDVYPDVAIALGRLDHRLLVVAWRQLNRLVRSEAARVVAIGRDMREKLIDDGVSADRVVVIPHWAASTRPTDAETAAARESMGWRSQFVVMHGGNLGLAQNLRTVLQAAWLLRDRRDVHFVLLGTGAARPELERQATELGLVNLEFIGVRPQREALPLLGAADLHLVSLAPGLKGSVVASKIYGILALGRPFVAAVDAGSEIALLAEETQAGIQVDPDDAHALAVSILEFVDEARDGLEAGRRGRVAFEARYTRAAGTRLYDELVRAVGDRRSSP